MIPRLILLLLCLSLSVQAAAPVRGSIVEDRAARKLLQAGDLRYDAGEQEKALEIWQSVVERYPKSKVRYQAHLKLGEHHLTKGNAYDKARAHFETVAGEENTDAEQRALATLKMGVCLFEGRHYGQCFKVMRKVIEEFPVAAQVNEAYYYIGLGHFKQGHYGRAISALEKVGTAVGQKDQNAEKLEAGKRFFVKIEDADLAILEKNESVPIKVRTSQGDEETVQCLPVGRNVRVVLGSIPTRLGKARKGNGVIEVTGTAKVQVDYVDSHTADRAFNVDRKKAVTVVGNALVQVMDGAFSEALQGVVLGKEANIQVSDADRDISDKADGLKVKVQVLRQKTPIEIEEEKAKLIAEGGVISPAPVEKPVVPTVSGIDPIEEQVQVDPFKVVDTVEMVLREAEKKPEEKVISRPVDSVPAKPEGDPAEPSAQPEATPALGDDLVQEINQEQKDGTIHTGIFRGTVPVESESSVVEGDAKLQAQSGDLIQVSYQDTLNISAGPRDLFAAAKCVEGNLGGVRVTRTEIGDAELALKTKLQTASALTQIGTQYRDFGLDDKAKRKYEEALGVWEELPLKRAKLEGGCSRKLTFSYGGYILQWTDLIWLLR